jgi:uncharacterized membrane protein (DUF2068 family)
MGGSSRRGDRVVVLIGVFKLVKSVVLMALGLGWLLGVARGDALVRAARWTGTLAGHHVLRGVVARLVSFDGHVMRELAIAALAYAGVFAIEGTGLMLGKRWAEWLTVGVTSSFIPIELYELVRHPGAGKVVALALNVAIVAYLASRLLETRASRLSRFRAA